jgi:branched-subunit amino acid transport protein
MSTFALIVAMALITLSSRLSFMLRPVTSQRLKENRFLEVFPVALFVTLAVAGFAPEGEVLSVTPSVIAGLGGMAGAALFKRSILGVVLVGAVAYLLARLLF